MKQYFWICEARFYKWKGNKRILGGWSPQPQWGASSISRKHAIEQLLRYTPNFGKPWLKKDGLLNRRKFRFRKYEALP